MENITLAKDSEENATCANYISKETVKLLAKGVLEVYEPNLLKTREQLKELIEKQSLLEDQMHQENLQISHFQNSPELTQVFTIIKEYQNKLSNIKKDMKIIHEKSIKLKKRVLRLQQLKENEKYLKEQQREMQIKKELDLIAKPSTSET